MSAQRDPQQALNDSLLFLGDAAVFARGNIHDLATVEKALARAEVYLANAQKALEQLKKVPKG